MYRLTCDGLPLLDWRDNDLVLVDPKVKLEVNKVGEGSFTIYKNHPHYDSLKKLKSVFEVSDDNGVIFRGRATGDTVDFDHGMLVDLEGVMAYFNDSIVRPFNFPDDFQVDGDRVAFFLEWLIDNHNAQVQDFQKMKLGNVTVQDADFSRMVSEYASTWEVLKSKLFDSSLGGYLCIRYEADGNYIDYLSEFTETNSQEIMFGENLLDLKNETEASETYSAIIPLGALGLTIEGLADGNITDDIVKSGDTLYSKKAVEAYGWIYAPTSATAWDEVTDETGLLTSGVEFLTGSGVFLNGMEATAVDLHFTDEQVESLRIYRNVNVRSGPHGVAESIPLAKLEIELLKPQNTKVKVGKTVKTLTSKTALQQEEAKKQYSKLSKTDEQIRLEVQDEIKNLAASVDISLDEISLELQGIADQYTKLAVTMDGVTVTDASGTTRIRGSSVETDTLYVDAAHITGTLEVDQINISGNISFSDLSDHETIEQQISSAASSGGYSKSQIKTFISDSLVASPTIAGANFYAFDGAETYANINENGFYLHHTDTSNPKVMLGIDQAEIDAGIDPDEASLYLILGAGSTNFNSNMGRLKLMKTDSMAGIYYYDQFSGERCGISFLPYGEMIFHGNVSGLTPKLAS